MVARYAEVVVNTSLRGGRRTSEGIHNAESWSARDALERTFHYGIPDLLRTQLQVGHMVRIPFGARVLQGIVVALTELSPVDETREIEDLLDACPVVNPLLVELARWMSKFYLAPIHSCLQQMLPPGLSQRAQLVVEKAPSRDIACAEAARRPDQEMEGPGDPSCLPHTQRVLLACLEKKSPREWRSLGRAAGQPDWEKALEDLISLGLVAKRWTLAAPRVRAKTTRFLRLAVDGDTLVDRLSSLGHRSKQADMLELLGASLDPIPTLEFLLKCARCSRGTARALEKKGWVTILPARSLVAISAPVPKIESTLDEDSDASSERAQVMRVLLARQQPVDEVNLREDVPCSESVLQSLEERGLLKRWKQKARVLLRLSPAQMPATLHSLRGIGPHAAITQYLQVAGSVPIEEVYRETGSKLRHVRRLIEHGLVHMEERGVWRDPLAGREFVLTAPPRLTPQQEAAWDEIRAGLRAQMQGADANGAAPPPSFLLHGVTGSGKTELYLHALQETLAAGRQAIVLVPEIALTPQTIRRFAARFPSRIAVMHSGLSPGERYDSWRRARAGAADVVIGPRSAVFAPLPRLGCIIIDEEHEAAYKQESTPRYHAREVALRRAEMEGAVVILGSATPDLGTYLRAMKGRFSLISLPQRVMGHRLRIEEQRSRLDIEPAETQFREPEDGYTDLRYLDLPPVEIVDMREELREGNRSIFSRALQKGLSEALGHRRQVILFLNRRGSATFILCRDCGLTLMCSRCDVPLSFHTDHVVPFTSMSSGSGRLVCHHCGREEPVPQICPNCGGSRIRYFGVGTQRVDQALHELYPEVRSLRWDRDTTGGANSHETILQAFVEHSADVLVGTQMLAKGLDLPLVTLVGVISADTALNLPDFRASERTFQLLTQVAGRAGRSILGGRAIIQTYSPQHYAIRAASRHDYQSFYEQEIAFRREQGYPPLIRLARLVYRDRDQSRCREEAERMADRLRLEFRRRGVSDASLIGPAPCFFSRLQGRYRWQILLRAYQPAELLYAIELNQGWVVDVDPVDVL